MNLNKKQRKQLQCLYAWSLFYTAKDSIDSKGEPVNRIKYNTYLQDKYEAIQEEIANFSAKHK